MLASLTRTKTFWMVVVVMLGYGIITWDDNDPGQTKPSDDDMVNLVLEIAMTDNSRNSIDVAVAATLGSAGFYSEPSTKVWNGLKFPEKHWFHRFRARHGDALNAEVANPGKPVTVMFCWFWQQGIDEVDEQEDVLPGYGGITGHHQDRGDLARCAAVVQ